MQLSILVQTLLLASTALAYTPVPQAQDARKVFAHFMMGNTYGATASFFSSEIAKAQAMGIDGFACNVGPDSWQKTSLRLMYDTAANSGFKIFVSLDMSVMSTATLDSLYPFVTPYTNHQAQYKVGGKQYVSTFTGDQYYGGQPTVAQAWLKFKNDLLAAGSDIYFVPAFTGYGATFLGWNAVDGGFSWNIWTKDTAEDTWYLAKRNNPETSGYNDPTVTYDQNSGGVAVYTGKTYMAGVSPWFFTHFDYKNWVYRNDDLYTTRWENLIRSKPDQIQIATWNDYGESHYIGGFDPVDGDFPYSNNPSVSNSLDWTKTPGIQHAALAGLTSYYISAYTAGVGSGSLPIPSQNSLYFWYRPHSVNAVASADPLPAPECRDQGASGVCPLKDNIYLTVLARSAFTVTVTSGSQSQTYTTTPGANHFVFAGFQEGTPTVRAGDNNIVPGPIPISNSVTKYNFNFIIGSYSWA